MSKCSSKRDKKVRGKFEEVPCFRNARRDSGKLESRREMGAKGRVGWLDLGMARGAIGERPVCLVLCGVKASLEATKTDV